MSELSEGSKREPSAISASDIIAQIGDDSSLQIHDVQSRHVSFHDGVDHKVMTPSFTEDEEIEDKIKKVTEMSFDNSPTTSPTPPTRTRGDTDRRIGKKSEISRYNPAERRATFHAKARKDTVGRSESFMRDDTEHKELPILGVERSFARNKMIACFVFIVSMCIYMIFQLLYIFLDIDYPEVSIIFPILATFSAFIILYKNVHWKLLVFSTETPPLWITSFLLIIKSIINIVTGWTLTQGKNSDTARTLAAALYPSWFIVIMFTDVLFYKPKFYDRISSVFAMIMSIAIIFAANIKQDDDDNLVLLHKIGDHGLDYTFTDLYILTFASVLINVLMVFRGAWFRKQMYCHILVTHASTAVEQSRKCWNSQWIVFGWMMLYGFVTSAITWPALEDQSNDEQWDWLNPYIIINNLFAVIFFIIVYPAFWRDNIDTRLVPFIFDRFDAIFIGIFVPVINLVIECWNPNNAATFLVASFFSASILCYTLLDSMVQKNVYILTCMTVFPIFASFTQFWYTFNSEDSIDKISAFGYSIEEGRIKRAMFSTFAVMTIRSMIVSFGNVCCKRNLHFFVRRRGIRFECEVIEGTWSGLELGSEGIAKSGEPGTSALTPGPFMLHFGSRSGENMDVTDVSNLSLDPAGSRSELPSLSYIQNTSVSRISTYFGDEERTLSQYSEISKIATMNTFFEDLTPALSPLVEIDEDETKFHPPALDGSAIEMVDLNSEIQLPSPGHTTPRKNSQKTFALTHGEHETEQSEEHSI